jgi:hypothetical protein
VNPPDAIVAYSRSKRVIGVVFWLWSLGSVALGAIGLWLFSKHPVLGPVATQFLIWGLINLVFAFMGLKDKDPASLDWTLPATRHDVMRKLLGIAKWIHFNHKLDMLWVGSGVALLVAVAIWRADALLGHGIGVLIQGVALMLIDRTFDAKLKHAIRGLR